MDSSVYDSNITPFDFSLAWWRNRVFVVWHQAVIWRSIYDESVRGSQYTNLHAWINVSVSVSDPQFKFQPYVPNKVSIAPTKTSFSWTPMEQIASNYSTTHIFRPSCSKYPYWKLGKLCMDHGSIFSPDNDILRTRNRT